MFEEFREQAEDSFLDEDDFDEEEQDGLAGATTKVRTTFRSMTPAQRFIILMLMLIVVCLVSSLCLLATGKVVPPLP
jgi:hypothetical protein